MANNSKLFQALGVSPNATIIDAPAPWTVTPLVAHARTAVAHDCTACVLARACQAAGEHVVVLRSVMYRAIGLELVYKYENSPDAKSYIRNLDERCIAGFGQPVTFLPPSTKRRVGARIGNGMHPTSTRGSGTRTPPVRRILPVFAS